MKYVVVIPARLRSTRLPEKPLINILGKSLIQRTYEQCIKAIEKDRVFVATDSPIIYEHCAGLNMQVVMTSDDCLTGTDRVAEFADQVEADYYINVQGDEPLMNPDDITKIINAISEYPGEILNGYTEILEEDLYWSRSIPKVVFSNTSKLLYMSRSPIPGNKSGEFEKSWRQVCIYSFPRKSLIDFRNCAKKTPIEEMEDIELVRFLELGFDVRMIELSSGSIAVDTPEDVLKVEQRLSQ